MNPARRSAFTLIELVSVIVVLTVLGSLGAAIIGQMGRHYRDNALVAELHTELSTALDRIAREVRSIPAATGGGPAADIRFASASELRWGEAMHVRLAGETLEFSNDLTNHYPLLTGVQHFALQFYDESDIALLTSPGETLLEGQPETLQIRRVSIAITVARAGSSETLSTKVFLRAAMSGGGS